MSQKILFIDVDGTLAGYNENGIYIPNSAIEAIQKTRKLGNLVYLCTGRGMAEIDETLTSIGLDGIIGAAGGFIIEKDSYIYKKVMKKEDVLEIMNFFDTHNIWYYLESNQGLYVSENLKNWMLQDKMSQSYVETMKPLKDADLNDINKFSFVCDCPYEIVENEFKNRFNVVRASWINEGMNAGEIGPNGITKGNAIEYLVNYLNLDMKDTYAFGDSMNDKEMLEICHTSIVMGNSMHSIKQYADFETKSLDDDGLYYAFEHYDLT